MLYSMRKTAKILGVNIATVKKAIEKGQIKTVTLSDRKRIPKSEIDRFLNPQKENR